jgi:hypothetical protein
VVFVEEIGYHRAMFHFLVVLVIRAHLEWHL